MKRHGSLSLWAELAQTLRLALPLAAAQVAVAAMGLVDTLTFGWLGTAALAGGGLGTAVFSLVNIVCVGVLTAVGNVVAFAAGAGDRGAIRGAVQAGLRIATALGAFAALLCALSGPALVGLGQAPAVVEGASRYLAFAALGIVPSLLFTALRGLAVGLGRPGPITMVTAAAVIL